MEPSRLDCTCSISSHRRMYRYMDSSLSFPLRWRPAIPRLVVKPPEPLALGEHRAALAPRAGIDRVERRVGRAVGLVASDWRMSNGSAWNAAPDSLWMHLPSSISTSPM